MLFSEPYEFLISMLQQIFPPYVLKDLETKASIGKTHETSVDNVLQIVLIQLNGLFYTCSNI